MSKETETINLTVTVQIPKKVHKLLERFAAFAGVSLEELLKKEADPDVCFFWHNEIFQKWVKHAIEASGCAEYFQVNLGDAK